jgi:2-dehydropantoate 2-reductase
MRFVIVGTGAIGGVLGGALAAAGQDVRLVARGAHLAALRRNGLRVDRPDGPATYRLPASALDDLEPDAGDVLLLTVKSQDTLTALRELTAAYPGGAPLVCAQNGVANEASALRFFPTTYGALVLCPAGHLEPGVVVQYGRRIPGLVDLSRYPSGADATAEAIAQAFAGAGFVSRVVPDIMPWKYRKLVRNCDNVVRALCGPDADVARVREVMWSECEAVLQRAGIASVTSSDLTSRQGDVLSPDNVPVQERGGSTWQSLSRGAGSIESDYLNGEIALLGSLHGVATPMNRLLQQVSNRLARERGRPGSVSPDWLLSQMTEALPQT